MLCVVWRFQTHANAKLLVLLFLSLPRTHTLSTVSQVQQAIRMNNTQHHTAKKERQKKQRWFALKRRSTSFHSLRTAMTVRFYVLFNDGLNWSKQRCWLKRPTKLKQTMMFIEMTDQIKAKNDFFLKWKTTHTKLWPTEVIVSSANSGTVKLAEHSVCVSSIESVSVWVCLHLCLLIVCCVSFGCCSTAVCQCFCVRCVMLLDCVVFVHITVPKMSH